MSLDSILLTAAQTNGQINGHYIGCKHGLATGQTRANGNCRPAVKMLNGYVPLVTVANELLTSGGIAEFVPSVSADLVLIHKEKDEDISRVV